MAETIEAFVGRLQAEGVEAGKQAAARIQAEAEEQARRIVEEARSKAKRIVESADAEAALFRKRAEAELALAVRDTLASLRETLSRMLARVLESDVQGVLSNGEFLQTVLHDIIRQYAQADSQGKSDIHINVSERVGDELTHWAVHRLREELQESGTRVELRSALSKAGFEYQVSAGTVEVTVESVVELLSSLIRPGLREILAEAAKGEPVEPRVAQAEGASA